MIDPKLFTVERLLATMLDDSHGNLDRWRKFAEIVPGHMPPYPGLDTQPKLVVRYRDNYLRYSKGPRQGFFWDSYGDDLHTPELALLALLQAPVPPSLCRREEWDRWREEEDRLTTGAQPAPDPMDLVLCGTYNCQNLKHRSAIFCGPCAAEYQEDPDAFK